jgi:glycosyltransferase involved in cell wall biosynthesis
MVEPSSTRGRQGQLREAIHRAIEDFRPDLVVSMLPQSDVACAGIRRSLTVPWVAMLHGSPWPQRGEMPFMRRIAWRAAVTAAYRRPDALVAVSQTLAATVAAGLALRAPIIVVGSGVDMPSEVPARPPREPVIGFVGRLSHEKASDIFIDIAQLLPGKALIFGDGPLAPQVAAAAAKAPRLEYHGWADRDEALASIDVLVVPSRREALPLVVMEAGARSLCVVARDTGGIGEVLGRDAEVAERCLLPTNATATDFAAALRPLLEAAEERERLGRALNQVVAEHFTLDRHVDRLLAALSGVLAGRR